MYFKKIHLCLPDMPGPPPHHHPNQRPPPPGMGAEHPPWGGGQHPDFGPPPHGFNGHSPHMRHRQHPVQDDPSLVPNVPYFDLPAGLMAPLVKVSYMLLMEHKKHMFSCSNFGYLTLVTFLQKGQNALVLILLMKTMMKNINPTNLFH